jgi:predicted phosphodiesterase
MKIHILCDLHIEFEEFIMPDSDSDIVILAGDTHVGLEGIKWVFENIKEKPVIYIFGNHEYYNHAYPKLLDKARELTIGTNVNILENDIITIEDYQFMGCSLWTDFKLLNDYKLSSHAAQELMTDFKRIRVNPKYHKFTPDVSSLVHKISLKWLRENSQNKYKKIIATHHAPSMLSIPEQFRDDMVSAAYASNLEYFIKSNSINLWIHGHIHHSSDYVLHDTRVICNPRGYPDESETGFNPKLVINV